MVDPSFGEEVTDWILDVAGLYVYQSQRQNAFGFTNLEYHISALNL